MACHTFSLPVQRLSCGDTAGPTHTAPVRSSSSDADGCLTLFCLQDKEKGLKKKEEKKEKEEHFHPQFMPTWHPDLAVSLVDDRIQNLQFVQVEACCRSRCALRGRARLLSTQGCMTDWSSSKTVGGNPAKDDDMLIDTCTGDRRSQATGPTHTHTCTHTLTLSL